MTSCPIVSEHATAFMTLKTTACTNLSSVLVYKSYFVRSVFVGHSCYLFIFSDLWLFSAYAHHHFLASPPTIHTHSAGAGVNCVQYFSTEGHRALPLWICSLLPIKHFRACLFFSAIKWHFWFMLSLRFPVTPNVLHGNLHNGSSSGLSIFFPYIT